MCVMGLGIAVKDFRVSVSLTYVFGKLELFSGGCMMYVNLDRKQPSRPQGSSEALGIVQSSSRVSLSLDPAREPKCSDIGPT